MPGALRFLLSAFVVTVACLLTADFLITPLTRNSVPRQTIQVISSAPNYIDLLGLGNSLVAAGLDPAPLKLAYRRKNIDAQVLNAGLGATGVIEHLALARLAMRDHRVGTLVYGYFDLSLADDLPHSNSDLIGNRAMLYYQEPDLTLKFAPFSYVDRLAFSVFRRSSLLRERGTIWNKVEKARRSISSIGMPQQKVNRFGRAADFSLLEARDTQAFSDQCTRLIRDNRLIAAPIQEMIQQATLRGINVVIVEMPMTPVHRRLFYSQSCWNEYRLKTEAALKLAGAKYVNASDWVQDESLFDDDLHLSSRGATAFSQRLALYLLP